MGWDELGGEGRLGWSGGSARAALYLAGRAALPASNPSPFHPPPLSFIPPPFFPNLVSPCQDCELLDLAGRPEDLLMSHLPVPPVCIRPSVEMDAGAGSNEDDVTMKLMQIVEVNNILRQVGGRGGWPGCPVWVGEWPGCRQLCVVEGWLFEWRGGGVGFVVWWQY